MAPPPLSPPPPPPPSSREARKAEAAAQRRRREERAENEKRLRTVVTRCPSSWSPAEHAALSACPELWQRLRRREERTRAVRGRSDERHESAEELQRKVFLLAEAVRGARCLIAYTGAGISTAAAIPDYRGPRGVWTLLKRGQSVGMVELSDAEPTLTHMCLAQLHREGLVQHVVSQNCDGLHVRSGLAPNALSELHGNMYMEACSMCGRQVVRLFDVTERTGVRRHETGRACEGPAGCGGPLRDTIVHFGERGTLERPLNWAGAAGAARKADAILCLGSSLKVLRRYPCLWGMERPPAQRPKLYIVNLQWTPKDAAAELKIHAACDEVLRLLMQQLGLGIPAYSRDTDPIFLMATPLSPGEEGSHSRRPIAPAATLAAVGPEPLCVIAQRSAGAFAAGEEAARPKGERTGLAAAPVEECELPYGTGEDVARAGGGGKVAVAGSLAAPGWFGKGLAKSRRVKRRKR
uniref:NAD-dependent protein deacetylase sirtuin-7 n=1 Tax=Petromyzon marinus TaxID=7757 RepID=A0AAJ7X6K6_PETMA|nr:NAD-dependent protein deacetylase sirtuin-7 [Petromyzon marinus]